MSLLTDTAEIVKARGVRIERWVEDPKAGKRIGFRCTIEGTRFYVSARSRIPDDGEVGVMARLVMMASDQDAMLLIRCGNRGFREAMVLDPDAYLEHGKRSTKDSGRRKRGEQWINIPASWACRLSGYVDGDAEPQTEPTKAERIQSDGGWFSV